MRACPNTNTKEWKMLMSHLEENEAEAYRAYIAHGYTIPPVITKSELKQAIGLTSAVYSSDRQIAINKKLRIYNEKNGTSHFVEYTPIGSGDVSSANIRFNYLPVNRKRQAERDRRRDMVEYGYLQDAESFENIYTPSESEKEAGRIVEGDFIPPLNLPLAGKRRAGPKFSALIESREADRDVLYQDRNKLYTANKKATTVEKKKQIASLIARVNRKIEDVERSIKELMELDNLADINQYAEQDMRTLETIFSKKKPTRQDLIIAARIIDIWDKAGNFDGIGRHIFYTDEEYEARNEGIKHITENFEKWRKIAIGYNRKLISLEQQLTEDAAKDRFKGLDEIDFEKPLPDINLVWGHILDISEVDSVLFQLTATWVKDANFAAGQEFKEVQNDIDELVKNAGLRNFEIFKQKFSNTDNRNTGDLVERFTKEFSDMIDGLLKTRKRAKDNAKENIQSYIRTNVELIEALRKNTEYINAQIFFYDPEIFPFSKPTQEQIENEKARLIGIFGEKGFQEYYDQAQTMFNEYKLQRIAQKEFYEAEFSEIADEMFDSWEVSNSPYYYAEVMKNGYTKTHLNGRKPFPSMEFVTPLAKNKEHFDNNFKKIEQDESYLELYNYMINLLQELKLYFPNEKVYFMHGNTIPFMEKKVTEAFVDSGFRNAMSKIADNAKKAVRIDNLSTIGTEEDKKSLQVSMIKNNQKEINEYLGIKELEYRAANNNDSPDADMVEEWRRDIISILADKRSFDLDRILKAYASTALVYKHKAMIEDHMRIMQRIIDRSLERKENAAGDQMFDRYSNVLTKKKGLNNMRSMMEDFMDVAYWGYPTDKPVGKTKMKTLTSDEKEARELLLTARDNLYTLYDEKKITLVEFEQRLDIINDQINSLGGVHTFSKYGDLILKYVQLRGMGWNVIAAFANIGFGFITNAVESSDGRNYSGKSFWKAQLMVMNSLPGVNKITPNGNKIRELVNYFDVLKEQKHELFGASKTRMFRRIGNKLDWANPYAPQSRVEYLNQAPVMIAMMMDKKVTQTINGESVEISMWEAFDYDGKLKEGVAITQRELLDFKVRVDKIVKINHGNYDPNTPLRVKRYILGRLLSQFRTWAFQGFAERFRSEIVDFQLHNQITGEDFVIRKGRYRSYGAYIKYMKERDGFFGASSVFDMTLQLLRKLGGPVFGTSTTFDQMVNEQFTATDAANMRKNMTEIVIKLFLSMFILMLRASMDDDDPRKKFAYYLLINNMTRLSTDIMFYSNPREFERLAKNVIPAFTLVNDAANAVSATYDLLIGREDILQSGPNKGKSKTLRNWQKLAPGTTQYQRIKSAGYQEFKK